MQKQLERIQVANIGDIPPQTGKTVDLNGMSIALFRLSTGEVRAIENRCPHKGGPLAEGIISGEHVFCPLHDWKINTTDGKVQEPDTGCVRTFPVDIADGMISIIIEK
jgi:nitrite reductase (NADH) small subunit